jgi:hypothetical protein
MINKFSAQEIKKLTGAKTRMQGEFILYSQLEGKEWFLDGRVCNVAGYDRRKDLVHFTSTWTHEPGIAGHRRVGVPLKIALDNETGILANYSILF